MLLPVEVTPSDDSKPMVMGIVEVGVHSVRNEKLLESVVPEQSGVT